MEIKVGDLLRLKKDHNFYSSISYDKSDYIAPGTLIRVETLSDANGLSSSVYVEDFTVVTTGSRYNGCGLDCERAFIEI